MKYLDKALFAIAALVIGLAVLAAGIVLAPLFGIRYAIGKTCDFLKAGKARAVAGAPLAKHRALVVALFIALPFIGLFYALRGAIRALREGIPADFADLMHAWRGGFLPH